LYFFWNFLSLGLNCDSLCLFHLFVLDFFRGFCIKLFGSLFEVIICLSVVFLCPCGNFTPLFSHQVSLCDFTVFCVILCFFISVCVSLYCFFVWCLSLSNQGSLSVGESGDHRGSPSQLAYWWEHFLTTNSHKHTYYHSYSKHTSAQEYFSPYK